MNQEVIGGRSALRHLTTLHGPLCCRSLFGNLMSLKIRQIITVLILIAGVDAFGQSQQAATTQVMGPYLYETKPDHPAFTVFNPRQAPNTEGPLLRKGDRLAICGDSITEQKMYSRMMETYLTVCVPDLEIQVRQYGWSGEKTDGFLRRMQQHCLTFQPTVATLAYGMNDARYRPYDVTNGKWYKDHYSAIVRNFKAADVKVIVGSPGCSGKIASWVKSRSGTLQEHNLNLCALRDIAIEVAEENGVRFADIFWPMYQAQVFAPGQHQATADKPYLVAGNDGIHPGWAGHVIMAWSMLKSMGLDGEIGTITVDPVAGTATVTEGHQLESVVDGVITVTSSKYPFCAEGSLNDHNSIRSGMTLVPFAEDLNRFMLKASVPAGSNWELAWGQQTKQFSSEQLAAGINLPVEFPVNPFSKAFQTVDEAVAKKQAYETQQVKKEFRSREAKANFEAIVAKTEAVRKPLADAVAAAMKPVTHQLKLTAVSPKN